MTLDKERLSVMLYLMLMGCSHLNQYLVVIPLFGCLFFILVTCTSSQMFELLTGSYELIPYYKGENTVFDVSPPVVSVNVEHQHVTIPQKFQVSHIVAYVVKTEYFILLWYLFSILLLYFLFH